MNLINNSSKIKIEFFEIDSNINIAADGQIHKSIKSNSTVLLSKSNIKAKFVYLNSMDTYYSKLRSKLNWIGINNS